MIVDRLEQAIVARADRVRARSRPIDHFFRAYARYDGIDGTRLAAATAYYGFFAAFALGVLAFVLAAVVHGELSSMPDWRLTVPGFVATAVAAAASIARREPRAYWLWGLGVGLAGAAIVLGWFLMVGIVVAATAIVILILHAVM